MSPSVPLISVKPLTVPAPGREEALRVRVTAPRSGRNLPVIVFSHGNGWSLDGYGPLVDRWAAAGFVVVQPTHPDSRRHAIGWDDPRFAAVWRVRIADLHAVLDHLGSVLADAGLTESADPERVAVVGHSWGAQTAGTLLGARVLDADGMRGEDFSHSGVTAGVLLTPAGTGDTLTDFAAEHLPFMHPDFTTMTAPTLIVAGGRDQSQLSTRGPEWFTDAYHRSPAPKNLLTLTEAEHTLGGIAGEMVAETTDEHPARVAFLGDATSAYLRAVLAHDPAGWDALRRSGAGDSGGGWSITTK
ncbi:alpha/beta hydrolase family protein [Streptomyces lonarensis]|uniref:Chlorophyllase n=1 Tax=Streptomyces lonarensis TaxID=700599 RepID=A0A7X6HZY7_9ACTN|nr:chlorophyllase [Streptomyces lonarensis]NJQ07091.1 chlorophyllase [Streptomyces lonarensis]